MRELEKTNDMDKVSSLEITTTVKFRNNKISFPVISPLLLKGMQLPYNYYRGTAGS